MKRKNSSKLLILGVAVLAIVLTFAFLELRGVQAQFPSLPKLPGGVKVPGAPSGKLDFAGVGALTAAKETLGEKDRPSYPTPNIAVGGNNIVIAWPNGLVTIETITDSGRIHRTVLGPPTERNIY